MENLIGKKWSDIKDLYADKEYRLIVEGQTQFISDEYVQGRINIHINTAGVITGVNYG